MTHENMCRAVRLSGPHRSNLMAAMKSWLGTPWCDPRRRRWSLMYLISVAIVSAWSEPSGAKARFDQAREAVVQMFDHARRPGRTYQGWIAALKKLGVRGVVRVRNRLCDRLGEVFAHHQRVAGWVAFAVDGSRFVVPRTRSNQAGCGQSAHRRAHPQLWLTMMWHLGLGVPWDWRIGPGDSDERRHARRMLHRLPAAALLVMDAGFAKFDLLRQVIDHGRHVLVRVGGNVTLLRGLGMKMRVHHHGQIVHLWPVDRRREGKPPLRLRLIVLHDGKRPVYLVTSVLDAERLSDADAALLYRRRWGVEVFYRGLKQTMQRRKLASREVSCAKLELHWLVVGAMLLGLLAAERLIATGQEVRRISVAGALRVLRQALRRSRWRGWRKGLAQALVDDYVRHASKSSRDYPRPKHDKPPGPPKFREATELENRRAKAFAMRPDVRS